MVNGSPIITLTDPSDFAPMVRALEALPSPLARLAWLRQAGMTFDGLRDLYQVLGYKRILTTADYRDRYERGGVAGRIVDAMPDATWRGSMELAEDKEGDKYTTFEQAWLDLDQRLQIQQKFLRVDKLARLSTFAVLLIGTKKSGELDQPLPKGKADDLIYLQAFSGGGGPMRGTVGSASQQNRAIALGSDCTIQEYDIDINSPRFGLPSLYQLRRTDIAAPDLQRPVHFSRIVHVAEGLLFDEVFGFPALERVWNLLDDLDKVTGGGSEAFWLRANQGLHLNIDKDMKFAEPKAGEKNELERLQEQASEYAHQMTRMIRTRGVDISTLGSDVANFANQADAILTQIAGARAMPKRILTGSEMGELASSQDRDNWKDQIDGRQTQYCAPVIVRQTADRLIEGGYLPQPKGGPSVYDVKWPHIQTMTEQERAQGAASWAGVNKTMGEVVYTNAEIRDHWSDYSPLEPDEIKPIGAPVRESVTETPGEADQPVDGEAPAPAPAALSAHQEDEMVSVLRAAIEAGNTAVINEIIGVRAAGDAPGHPFHGNQYGDGEEGDEEGTPTKSGKDVKAQAGAIADIAQKVYDDWDENPDEYAGGGICHLIADEIVGHLDSMGIEATTVSAQQGEQHVWAVAKLKDGVYEIDIPPSTYETGAGYNWQKVPDVKLTKDDIVVNKISANPKDFKDYLDG